MATADMLISSSDPRVAEAAAMRSHRIGSPEKDNVDSIEAASAFDLNKSPGNANRLDYERGEHFE